MPVHAEIALIYFALISLISLFVTLADKRRARLRRWRVPEAALFWLSAIGGSAAMYAAMRLARHKTLKRRFMIGIPCIAAVQAAFLIFVHRRDIAGWFGSLLTAK